MKRESSKQLTRRRFLTQTMTAAGAAYGMLELSGAHRLLASEAPLPELVAVRNGDPDVMFDRAIKELGGMNQFVKKGSTVLVKPNIGWNRGPETGANTHPLLVKRIVEQSLAAGAKKVYVFDNTVAWAWKAYKNSGIEQAVKEAGGKMVPANKERYYQQVEIPKAVTLKKAQVHEVYLEADTIINAPVLKHHGSARLTIAMKNLMGVVWDRRFWHNNGLHQSIADFGLFKKPNLNVIDAYRITLRNGPARAQPEDLLLRKSLLLSKDIVCADAAGAKLFGLEPDQVRYITLADKTKLGSMELKNRNISRIVI